MSVKELTRQIFRQFIESFDTILFDCDGVLWQGNEVISKAPDVIRRLRDMGKQPLFVTNNSTKSRRQYIEKFNKLGFQVSENEIFCTAYLAAIYMRNILKFDGKVYLMGSPGLEEEFKLFNINYTGTGPDPVTGDVEWTKIPLDPEIGAVVVGFDRDVSYAKLVKAGSYLRDPSIPFIATNMDSCLPVRDSGYLIPGTGAIVSAVEMAAGRKPLVLGKPHKYMVDLIREKEVLACIGVSGKLTEVTSHKHAISYISLRSYKAAFVNVHIRPEKDSNGGRSFKHRHSSREEFRSANTYGANRCIKAFRSRRKCKEY